ncbi:GAG-pre-integrase domain-containing protein, partial [Bosea sp. (in: a-proteobacteria)]|uniref:GAG-pre-integrase domain-containing protein n=1 Tax=Bosea sp. (in: a-proteobacteria) TaxID=1871050 RepID=UPI004034809A
MPYFIDSGASKHICTNASSLTSFLPYTAPQPVYLAAAGHQLNAVGEGDAWLRTDQGILCLKHALLVPSASANFVSVAQATAAGYKFTFQGDSCLMEGSYRGHSLCMQVSKQNDSYPFQAASIVMAPSAPNQLCSSFISATAANLTAATSVSGPEETTSEQQLLDTASSGHSRTSVSPKVWHERLGHASYSVLERMQREHMVTGVDTTASQFRAAGSDPAVCEGCVVGKQNRHVHFPLPSPNAPAVTAALGLIHMDVCGPFSLAARDGSRYLATFLDEFTKFSVVMPL